MGMWGKGLFSNDTSCDVRDSYIALLKKGCDGETAFQKLLEEYDEILLTDENVFFWYALAYTQWEYGLLSEEVKRKTESLIKSQALKTFFEEHMVKASKFDSIERNLSETLRLPMPCKKIVREKAFITNPWEIGDVYAYRFHTEKAANTGFNNKYILFHKLADVEYYEEKIYSMVRIYSRIYDAIPRLEEINDFSVLPFVYSPNYSDTPDSMDDYIPSFEYFTQATMLLYKKNHYPKKHLFFVGNLETERIEPHPNNYTSFFWDKDEMDDWIIDYYLDWKEYNSAF